KWNGFSRMVWACPFPNRHYMSRIIKKAVRNVGASSFVMGVPIVENAREAFLFLCLSENGGVDGCFSLPIP
ncbi:MAG TPA: hypothetical protein DEP42_07145, partial [Ruminococcaceae bacterium]|nr:hypothetical protein [Oscillospiraceae bacterium]